MRVIPYALRRAAPLRGCEVVVRRRRFSRRYSRKEPLSGDGPVSAQQHFMPRRARDDTASQAPFNPQMSRKLRATGSLPVRSASTVSPAIAVWPSPTSGTTWDGR